MPPVIQISGLTKTYAGGFTALKSVDLTIAKGEIFALLLFAGLAAGKPLLRYVFGPIFEGLTETGWLKLSRNWALFFAAMAVVNELLRAQLSFEDWLTVKVWGVTALSLLFAFANIPMLMRHGFSVPDPAEDTPIPPQG